MTDVIETCTDRDIEDGSELTLDNLLSFDGVEKNSCLQRIRREMYDETFLLGEDVNLRLCNGEYDYQCPDYTNLGYILSVDDGIVIVSSDQNGLQQNTFFVYFFVLSVISMNAIAWIYIYRQCKKER